MADVHAAWQDDRYVRTAPVDFPLAGFQPKGVLRSRTRARTGGRLDLAVYSLIRADIGR